MKEVVGELETETVEVAIVQEGHELVQLTEELEEVVDEIATPEEVTEDQIAEDINTLKVDITEGGDAAAIEDEIVMVV